MLRNTMWKSPLPYYSSLLPRSICIQCSYKPQAANERSWFCLIRPCLYSAYSSWHAVSMGYGTPELACNCHVLFEYSVATGWYCHIGPCLYSAHLYEALDELFQFHPPQRWALSVCDIRSGIHSFKPRTRILFIDDAIPLPFIIHYCLGIPTATVGYW